MSFKVIDCIIIEIIPYRCISYAVKLIFFRLEAKLLMCLLNSYKLK